MLEMFKFARNGEKNGKAPKPAKPSKPKKAKPAKPPKPVPVLPPGIIGVDEAGRGPVMGPLVVVALRVQDDVILRELEVRDSKALTPARREDLYDRIKAVSKFQVEIVTAEEIDELRKSRNLNEIELDLFAAAIGKLLNEGDKIFVDAADVREGYFGDQIALRLKQGKSPCNFEIVSKHKADAIYPVVSAASIIAKVTRDRIIHDIEKELRKTLDKPLGSGYPSDSVTINFMENWIKTKGDLPPHTRRSWDTSQHLLATAKTISLDHFGIWTDAAGNPKPKEPEEENSDEAYKRDDAEQEGSSEE
jgi:ribonuclease HII